ncbi:MAG: thioredoxin family protein [Anaerolineales bacterium]
MDEILLRAALAVCIALAGLAAYWALNRLLLWRIKKKPLGLEDLRPGKPAILYFTTPDCQPCKTQQRPALAKLEERLQGAVQVIQVDATQRTDLADYWGVLTVPTTFIIDSHGRPRGVNHGVASAEKLQRQLEQTEGKKFSGDFKGTSTLEYGDGSSEDTILGIPR